MNQTPVPRRQRNSKHRGPSFLLDAVRVVVSVGLLVCCPGMRSAETRPNIIVILCDDLGYGDLGCYGHPDIRTPRLNQLALEGIRFTDFYSAAPVCSPSRVGLLTGRSPNRAGVYDWIPEARGSSTDLRDAVHLRKEEVTLAGLLKQAGYATCMSGKWHCNSKFNDESQPQPGDFGFDHWMATHNNAQPSHHNPQNYVRNGQPTGLIEGFSCHIAAGEVMGWLDKHVESRTNQPFFIYLAFHEPHEPVASPPNLVRQYGKAVENEDQAQYFANVENMDQAVGRVLDKLDELKLNENTLVVFTSDNGPETLNRYRGSNRSYGSAGPLRGMKLWTTEAGIRVPGIMRWPGKIAPGQVSSQPVSSLDFLPTFCAMAGVGIPEDRPLDGADFRPALRNQDIDRSKPLMWCYYNALNVERVAMRFGDWKMLAKLDGGRLPRHQNVFAGNALEILGAEPTDTVLYNLRDDFGEATDVTDIFPDKAEEMVNRLKKTYRELVSDSHVWR